MNDEDQNVYYSKESLSSHPRNQEAEKMDDLFGKIKVKY